MSITINRVIVKKMLGLKVGIHFSLLRIILQKHGNPFSIYLIYIDF